VSTGATRQKLLAALDIQRVITSAHVFGSAISTKVNEARHGVCYHTMAARVTVFGHGFVTVITVKEASDGKRFYNNIAVQGDKKERPGSNSPREQQSGDSGSASAFTGARDSVLPPMRRVNPNDVSTDIDLDTGEPVFR
jgi:hypothetical protein